MILKTFCRLFPKDVSCFFVAPRRELFDARDRLKYLSTCYGSYSRYFVENCLCIRFFTRTTIVIDGKTMGFITNFLEYHEFSWSLFEENWFRIVRKEYFFNSLRKRYEWWYKMGWMSRDSFFCMRELSFTTIDDDEIWPHIFASEGSESSSGEYLVHRSKVIYSTCF